MIMKDDMDLQVKIQTAMNEYLQSDKLEKRIQDSVEQCVDDVVKSLFGYHGTLKETLTTAFKERIGVDLTQIDFTTANEIITGLVKRKTAEGFQGPLLARLGAELDELFQPAPKECKLQDIIDILREDQANSYGSGKLTVEISRESYGTSVRVWDTDGKTYDGGYLSSRTSERSPILHMYVGRQGKISLIHDLQTKAMKGLGSGIYGADAKLFSMYCGGTVITDIAKVNSYDLNLQIGENDDY